jgi:hypothetical protein
MLLVATTRPELFEKAPGFGQAARNSNRINLSALTETETARLVSELLESTALPAEVQSLIVDRSGGNPLYAEEFARLLKDTGILTKDGSNWVLDRDADVPVPTSVQGLIAARLDTLEQSGDFQAVTAEARRFLVLAGDRALGLDSASAEASYRRALELSPQEEAGRAGVLAQLAEVLLQRARYAEADAALDDAIQAFRARGNVRDAARAAARRSIVLWRLGDMRHGQLADEAIELLEGLPPGPELVAVLADRAGDSLSSADYGASVAHAERAINLARELGLLEPFRAYGSAAHLAAT